MGGRCPTLERFEFGLLNRRPSFRAPEWVELNFRSFSLWGKGLERGHTRVAGFHAPSLALRPCHVIGLRPSSCEDRPARATPTRLAICPQPISVSGRGRPMARPMQLIGRGFPKEDIVAKLMRTALLIGLAVTWHPGAAAGQYSWSNFSVALGFGTGGAGFGVGASYAAVDPFYDSDYADPCLDYAYYEWNRHACSREYDSIHLRQNYSVVSVNPYRRPRWPSYYRPYGYYGYPSYNHFSISFGLHFGYGYASPYYGSHYHAPAYYRYGYPTYGYGYPAYGYGYGSGYGYGYPAYGVVRYGGSRRATAVIRPVPAYRGSPLVRSSPLYKESPQAGAQRTAQRTMAARSITSRTTAATRSVSDRRTRASGLERNVREQPVRARALSTRAEASNRSRVRPSDAVSRGRADRTDGLRARRGTPTRLYPPSRARATTSRRPSTSSGRASANTTQRSAQTPSVRPDRASRAPVTRGSGTSGAVTRSLSMRERAPTTRSAPTNARARPSGARPSGPPQARTASPSRSRAIRPSARPAPTRTPARASAARRAPPTRSAAPRMTAPRSRASSGGASRGGARARAARPARSRSPRR